MPVFVTNNRDNPAGGAARSYDYVGYSYYETQGGRDVGQSTPTGSTLLTPSG